MVVVDINGTKICFIFMKYFTETECDIANVKYLNLKSSLIKVFKIMNGITLY